MEFSQSNEKLIYLIKRKNLSKGRINQYNITFDELNKLLGKKPTELIKEAKKE